MKKAILLGAVAFVLGAASTPRAANENEALTILCARYKASVRGRQIAATNLVGRLDKALEAPWRNDEKIEERISRAEARATAEALDAIGRVVCR